MSEVLLEYRPATLDEVHLVKQIIETGFRARGSQDGWTGPYEQLATSFTIGIDVISNTVSGPDKDFMLAIDKSNNDAIAACFSIAKRSADMARFALFVVTPAYQKRKLGRLILAYAEKYSQQRWGVSKVEMDALSSREQLIAWYVRCGYQKTGVTVPFPAEAKKGIEGLPDDLGFVQLEKSLDTAVASAGEGAVAAEYLLK